MNLEQVSNLLPESVVQIVHLIGYPATACLLKAFGGTTFPIGKGLRYMGSACAGLLRETIGDENTKLLVKHFNGDVLYLPRCDQALRELRNRRFLAEFEDVTNNGTSALMTMTLLCPKYGFSDRFGWQLLAQKKSAFHNDQRMFF